LTQETFQRQPQFVQLAHDDDGLDRRQWTFLLFLAFLASMHYIDLFSADKTAEMLGKKFVLIHMCIVLSSDQRQIGLFRSKSSIILAFESFRCASCTFLIVVTQ
jgi:hypothetical protein